MGAEILVPVGRQELFDSGVQHYYAYGKLYNTSTKILARTTSQDRMLKSAEYFMAGFFGLSWTENATLEVIIEDPKGSNNSLAGYFGCNNSNTYVSTGGNNASRIWENEYLANATERLSALTEGYNWTIADAYNVKDLPTINITSILTDLCRLKPSAPTRPSHSATPPSATSSPTKNGKASNTPSTSNSTATTASAPRPEGL